MRLRTCIFAFLWLVAVLCTRAADEPIHAVGVLSLQTFPGRPNYESIENGDEPEKAWILTITEAGKAETFHLVVLKDTEEKFATLRRLKGKKIVVDGEVWAAETAHHHAPFLITVSTVQEAPRQVMRNGFLISIPEGEWKQSAGTCTGDWFWSQQGVSFSIGTRRYLAKDHEWSSTGDLYDISRFEDLQLQVIAVRQYGARRFVKAETRKARDGAAILVLEFDISAGKEQSTPTREFLAFREAPDHREVVEISCSYPEGQKELGTKTFEAAVASLGEAPQP